MEHVRFWPENSLPTPFAVFAPEAKASDAPPPQEEIIVDDNFPKGRVFKYLTNQGYGFVKDRAGREVYFSVEEMDFVGAKGKEALKEGLLVGYDLSHSGSGLHVRKMKIY